MQNLFKHFLIFFCIFFLSLSVNAEVKKPSTSINKSPAKKSISPKTKQTIKDPLSIKNISLKSGAIHVTIAANRILLPADYVGVTLQVTTPQHRAGKKWSLQRVDLKRSFSKSKKPVTFNTRVVLKAPGTVTATLSKGIWKTSRKSRLSPTKVMNKKLPKTEIKGKSPQIKGTKKKVVPMISENNGIAVSTSPVANSMIQKHLEESSDEVKSCDYSIESVTFRDGRSLATGIDARDGSTISGIFRVKVRWNRIPLPSTFAPGTEWGNRMTVRSTLTNDIINIPRSGINFDYTDADPGVVDNITVYVPFEFARDDIARMMTDTRNIPLEFSFEPTGTSVDIDGSNNRLEADMKVSFAKIVDLQIMFYIDDFSLERDRHWPGTAPIYDYHFTQSRIRVRNAATTVMGTAPADLLNVPVAWYIEWKPDGGNWSTAPIAQGHFDYDIVSADWTDPLNLSSSFSTAIDDPNRIYRLRMVIDPNNEYIDSNRSDNQFFNTIGNPD